MHKRAYLQSGPVILVEPPLYDCRAPHLGCAVLAASLDQDSCTVIVKDLNLQAILWLLQPEQLAMARGKVAQRHDALLDRLQGARATGVPLGPEDRYGLWRTLGALRGGSQLADLVRGAVETLRDPTGFYQPAAHRTARAMINTALDLHALACDDRLHVSISPQQYNGPYRTSSLLDLFAATRDRAGNLFLPFFEQVAVPELLEQRPRLIGISIANVFQVIPGLTLARCLRDAGCFVVIGGTFFSKFGPQLAAHPEFFDLCDALAVGEGERTLAGLVSVASGEGELARVPNLIYREGRRVVATPFALDARIPEPYAADFRSLPLDQYLVPAPVLPIYAGKGCSWGHCTFCEIPQINHDFGRWRRVRHPRRIVEEIRVQHERHGARHFVFTDESLEPRLLARLAEEIEASNLNVHYLGYTRFSPAFDRQFCEKLARSGCRKLLFGLESGCQHVNDQCRKGVDLSLVPSIVEACQSAGIAVHIFSIMGLPGEGVAEAQESAAYLSRLVERLDLPASTLDVSAFYLNWNSWLRRNAADAGITYQTTQDLPLHVEVYQFESGMDSRSAEQVADAVYRQLCWEASPLGFEIGYRDPIWPGWEEYTLLYLARAAETGDRHAYRWPATEHDLLSHIVMPAESLMLQSLPCSLAALADGSCDGSPSLLALAPSADPAEVPPRLAEVLSEGCSLRVSDLIDLLCEDASSDEARMEALAEVVGLIHAGVLQW